MMDIFHLYILPDILDIYFAMRRSLSQMILYKWMKTLILCYNFLDLKLEKSAIRF